MCSWFQKLTIVIHNNREDAVSDYKLGTAGAAMVGVKVLFWENILFVSVQVRLLKIKHLMHIHVVFTIALSVAPVDK